MPLDIKCRMNLYCEDVFVQVVASFGPKKASETILEHERFPGGARP